MMKNFTYLPLLSRHIQPYLPISTSLDSPLIGPTGRGTSSKWWGKLAAAIVFIAGIILVVWRHNARPRFTYIYKNEEGREGMRGLSIKQGWRPSYDLLDLGEHTEKVYKLGFESGPDGAASYYQTLNGFVDTLPLSIRAPLHDSLRYHYPASGWRSLSKVESRPRPTLFDYKTVFTTDKKESAQTISAGSKWTQVNNATGWEVEFYNDETAGKWVRDVFAGSDIVWAWNYIKRGVIRADLLRYLLPLIKGGVYADVDVDPHKPIEDWGTVDVEYLDISETDGPDWKDNLAEHPAVIVGLEVDVHKMLEWHNWPRPLGLCQWTFGSAPSHPIFIDAARRLVEATRTVQKWDTWKIETAQKLRDMGEERAARKVELRQTTEIMTVLEWSGPALFTDSVLAFLHTRYNVTWHRLRGNYRPLRIGDIVILPVVAFTPDNVDDFGSGPYTHPQGAVVHNFRQGWRTDGE